MTTDPFDMLGLPPVFDVDPAAIRRAYLERAKTAHPDRAGTGAEEDSAAESALLNDAKRAVDDPEQRAEVLLARLGGPRRDQDRTLPPGFLAEMLSVREEMESALAGGDEAARAKWEGWATHRREAHIRTISDLFTRHVRTGDSSVLFQIRHELNVWRYTERLLEQLAESA